MEDHVESCSSTNLIIRILTFHETMHRAYGTGVCRLNLTRSNPSTSLLAMSRCSPPRSTIKSETVTVYGRSLINSRSGIVADVNYVSGEKINQMIEMKAGAGGSALKRGGVRLDQSAVVANAA
ncbi:hypothetical protein B0J17DRAFT_665542 [Rhizoctonia solani]|nr:hypothetical protein B0J17DRAFT_665542 [Rhizoctonia solani]